MKKKLLFIVDVRNWAFDSIARSLQRRLASEFSIEILYWEDFSRPESLIEAVNTHNPDVVHFFFREHLFLLMQLMDRRARTARAFCSRAITTHVPDYLHGEQMDLFNRKALFDFVDAYFTTNADLFDVYSNCLFIPKPFGVIHDWIDIEPGKPTARKDGAVRIIWSGNSRWGEYAGYIDYKGLNSIIRPAIDAVQQKFPHVEFDCLDSARKRLPHSVIMKSMQAASILLIASRKEGTPLPLIEAMANGCAIVTTRVGIASEILPPEQHEFICAANPSSFQEKLERLVADPALIDRLADLNHQVWKDHFGDAGPLKNAWIAFLTHALERHGQEGVHRKLALLHERDAMGRKLTVGTLRLGARFVNRLGLVETLNRTTPRLGSTYHRIVYGSSQNRVDYATVDQIYEMSLANVNKDHPLVVYAPFWKGVCASSEAIFTENRIRFPFTDNEYPEVERHRYLETLASKLASSGVPAIVYSGGSVIHRSLAREVRARNRRMRQFFMWHGSPAQWIDSGQLDFFHGWRTEYENGVIDGLIVLKPGLDRILEQMDIWSDYIFNPIPSFEEGARPRTLSRDCIHVGLFSSIGTWHKNPFPQLLALSGMQNIWLTTSLSKSDMRLARPRIGRIDHVEHMNHGSFVRVLAQQDINLYVTNTECSPMIPAESWECLVPCIVGPAGDIYSTVCRELGDYLVEPRVDDPHAIRERLERVIEDYTAISELLYHHRDRQRELFFRQRRRLFERLRAAPLRSDDPRFNHDGAEAAGRHGTARPALNPKGLKEEASGARQFGA